MMPIYTARSMARAEEEIISRYTLSPEILMEHAGFSMASRIGQFCRERKPASVDILCGTGHNGGDGYVIARALSQKGFSVRLFTAGGRLKPLTAVNRQRCECLGIACNPIETFNPTAGVVVVDALFGIGLNRPLSSLWKDLFERIRTAKVPVIAVDTPSGLFEERKSDDPILGADLTLTVEYPKREFYTPENRRFCGIIETVSAAFPQTVSVLPDAVLGTPKIPETDYSLFSHKYTKGHAALWAGSAGYPGAALLASRAALKTGTGLLTLLTDSPTAEAVLREDPSVIIGTNRMPDTPEKITAWGCGCGWGRETSRLPILERFIETAVPRVIDADALNLLAEHFPDARFADGAVLTPHPGEWKRLCPDSSRFYDDLSRFAGRKNCTVIYKSSFSVIVSPEGETTIFDSPLPELGTAGSGDVLTGILLSFLARGIPPYRAAIGAVAFHNAAGKEAAARYGLFTAAELIETAASMLKHSASKEESAL